VLQAGQAVLGAAGASHVLQASLHSFLRLHSFQLSSLPVLWHVCVLYVAAGQAVLGAADAVDGLLMHHSRPSC
jgi:hypothetical protein